MPRCLYDLVEGHLTADRFGICLAEVAAGMGTARFLTEPTEGRDSQCHKGGVG